MERVFALVEQCPFWLQQLWMAKRSLIGSMILLMADYAVLLATFALAQWMRVWLGNVWGMTGFYFPFQSWFLSGPLLTVAFIAYEGMYTKRLPFAQGAQKLFRAVFFSMCTTFALLFLSHTYDLSRLFLLLYGGIGFVLVLVERYFLKRTLVAWGVWKYSVLIIGAGKTATLLAEAFSQDKGIGYTIAGVVDDCSDARPLIRKYPYLGGFGSIPSAIKVNRPDEVIIAAPGIGREKLLEILYMVQPLVRKVSLIPDLYGMPLSNIEADTFFNQKVVLLRITNNLASKSNKMIKRLFDVIVGVLAFAICLLPMLLIAHLIKRDSRGSAFFNDERIGKNGDLFLCYKFRTMYVNSDEILEQYFAEYPEARDEWNTYAKLRGEDPRVTRIGRFLRKTSLDELPQLLNVLKGDMSLVGPRPYLPREQQAIGDDFSDVISVLPGVTGLWQVSGRNELSFRERVLMDVWYIRNWSIWMDMVMMVKTVGVVLAKKGAY